ncbi:MAG TPA: response regulator transcription factor [Acidimicrobiales bacterium]|nr:response regulator transcription factor [Acidimicrobiales bacterium]
MPDPAAGTIASVRLLVAEDDPGLRSVLERALRRNGYAVDAVADGDRALACLRGLSYDAVVMDWRMPGQPGVDVVRLARRGGTRIPILMLTACDTTADRVEGLDAGADDYLVKPFELAELLARLRALLRRPPVALDPVLRAGDLELDLATRELRCAGELVALTARELAILEVLLRRRPSVVARRALAASVWDDESDAVGSNTIDVHVARLRAKLGPSGAVVQTVRGVGYRIGEDAAALGDGTPPDGGRPGGG